MKNIITFLILAIALQSCESKAQNTRENLNEIKAVSVSMFGGRSTIISKTYIITKDSVRYSLIAHDTTRNVLKSYLNPKQDWESLLEKIDLEGFKNIENGKSYQETDGHDTEITITTQSEKITKMNPDKNKSWNKVYRQLVQTYFKHN